MKKLLLAVALFVVLTGGVWAADEGYVALAYPTFDASAGEYQILGAFLYTDQESPDIELKALFRPVMVDVAKGSETWKTMNANLASSFNPEVAIENPGKDCAFKVTFDFAKSKQKPNAKDMAAIMAAVLTTFADDADVQKGIRFDLQNLANVPYTVKTLYKPSDKSISALMALSNPEAQPEPQTRAPAPK